MKVARSESAYYLLRLATCVLLTVIFTAASFARAEQESSFHWDFINVEIDVKENGDMLVTERMKYVFTAPYTNERYRWIPLDKVDDITDVQVLEHAKPIRHSEARERGRLWIRWTHELNAPESRTFVIKYRVIGGLHIRDRSDGVFWKAIFGDRAAPVQRAHVTVRLPDAVAGQTTEYRSIGSPAQTRWLDARTIQYTVRGEMSPDETLTVKVLFPHGLLDVPVPRWIEAEPSADRSGGVPIPNWLAIALFLVFLLIVLLNVLKEEGRSGGGWGGGSSGGGGAGGGGGGGGG